MSDPIERVIISRGIQSPSQMREADDLVFPTGPPVRVHPDGRREYRHMVHYGPPPGDDVLFSWRAGEGDVTPRGVEDAEWEEVDES